MGIAWTKNLVGIAIFALSAGAAQAEDGPRIEGEISIEVENDWIYESDDRDAELNDLYTTIEPDLSVFATDEIFVNTHLTLEPVLDPGPRDDRIFEDEGLYVEVLTFNYATDKFFAYAGKFGPNFSLAYDAAPGIYGSDFASDDIELAERIGFGGGVAFGDGAIPLGAGGFGRHTVSASVFFADTTFLSESAFTNRGRVRKSDGGPSNTENLDSFALALDGEEMPQAPGLHYHLGIARQNVDLVLDDDGMPVADTADEFRVAAAAEWGIEVDEDVIVVPLLEYVRFWNAEGLDSVNRDYITAAGLLAYRNWNLALAYTGRFTEDDTGQDFDDYQFQISAGYAFDFGLSIDVGWKFIDEADAQTQILGALFAYTVEF